MTKEKRKKKPKKKTVEGFVIKTFFVCFLITLSFVFTDKMQEYQILKEEEMKILTEIKKEEQKKTEYNENKDYYQSDMYIEKIAREQLGLIKDNEILYINKN